MPHYYGDTSNLNAPYDAIALQGLGATTWDGKTLPSIGFPWREASNDTLEQQFRLNSELAKEDFCPLLVDGELGPRTCGAMFILDHVGVPDGMVATCSQHAGEAMEPKVCPGGVVPEPPPPPEPVEPIAPKKAGVPMWVWGAGIAVIAIGTAFALKKKKR